MRILFLSTRQAKPSFRFRVEQMLPFFRACGHDCHVRFLPQGLVSRLLLVRSASAFDAVFVQKRLFSAAELFLLRRQAPRLIYDLDDAVMYDGDGRNDGRRRARFRAMVRAADVVLCGNEYLADETRRDGGRAVVLPTCIDTHIFHPDARRTALSKREPTNLVAIGWTGSRSTNRYLGELFPTLATLAGSVRVHVMSDTTDGLDPARLGSVPFQFTPWAPEVEVTATAGFDIGLMPLPDDPWTRGKCGFKALQYMGLGLPAVCSPVGVNRDILTHGETGFLPTTPEEWRRVLFDLAADAALRERIGAAGRRRVENAYSLAVIGPRTVEAVEAATAALRRTG